MSMVLSREEMMNPYYALYINGKAISEDIKGYITEIEFEESDREADSVRITVSDKDYVFSNMTNLAENTPLKLIMGTHQHYRTMFNGEVTYIEADYGEDGLPILSIGAVDETNKMTFVKKSRTFKKMKVSAIVAKIAREYGYSAVVQDTGAAEDSITQDNETDAQFIAGQADSFGYKFYIVPEKKQIYFGDVTLNLAVKETLYYDMADDSIISFRPTLVDKNKKANVVATKAKKSNISDKTGKKVKKDISKGSKSIKSKVVPTNSKGASKVGISLITGEIVTQKKSSSSKAKEQKLRNRYRGK
jgi:phage protein D